MGRKRLLLVYHGRDAAESVRNLFKLYPWEWIAGDEFGENIDMVMGTEVICRTGGEYGEEGYVYQEMFKLPDYGNNYPLIGSWIIGREPAGIGIR